MARKKLAPSRRTRKSRRLAGGSKNSLGELVVPGSKRVKPGVRAMREVFRLQKGTEFLLRRAPFVRVVREIAEKCTTAESGLAVRWRKTALEALQIAAEDFLIELFKRSNRCALHAKRVTIKPKDMELAIDLRKDYEIYKNVDKFVLNSDKELKKTKDDGGNYTKWNQEEQKASIGWGWR